MRTRSSSRMSDSHPTLGRFRFHYIPLLAYLFEILADAPVSHTRSYLFFAARLSHPCHPPSDPFNARTHKRTQQPNVSQIKETLNLIALIDALLLSVVAGLPFSFTYQDYMDSVARHTPNNADYADPDVTGWPQVRKPKILVLVGFRPASIFQPSSRGHLRVSPVSISLSIHAPIWYTGWLQDGYGIWMVGYQFAADLRNGDNVTMPWRSEGYNPWCVRLLARHYPLVLH